MAGQAGDAANTARREDLLGGDADAYDEIAASEDRAAASLPSDQDWTQLRAYTTTKLEEFLSGAEIAAVVAAEDASSPAPTEAPHLTGKSGARRPPPLLPSAAASTPQRANRPRRQAEPNALPPATTEPARPG